MPLSIGLFGEWGSGKSYFMGLLRGQVATLADSPDDRYCREIVQIGFNAWHYADSNLWASLGDEIFEQLAGPGETADARAERLREDLAQRLQRRRELETATERAREETVRLQNELDTAIAAGDIGARGLVEAVLESDDAGRRVQEGVEGARRQRRGGSGSAAGRGAPRGAVRRAGARPGVLRAARRPPARGRGARRPRGRRGGDLRVGHDRRRRPRRPRRRGRPPSCGSPPARAPASGSCTRSRRRFAPRRTRRSPRS